MKAKTALVPIAHGCEEIEAVTLIDVLRRAGVEVTVASVAPGATVTGAHGLRITADTQIAEVRQKEFDLIALPGGLPGAEHLRDSAELVTMLHQQERRGALLGAICASPGVVLATHGLIGQHKATAYPGFEQNFPPGGAQATRVVCDGNLITSRGPGTALEFALALVDALCGCETAEKLAAGMLVGR